MSRKRINAAALMRPHRPHRSADIASERREPSRRPEAGHATDTGAQHLSASEILRPTQQETPPEAPVSAVAPEGADMISKPISEELVIEALKEVLDPELLISIVDLGLVYGVDIDGRSLRVRMTLTSPGCPIGPALQTEAQGVIQREWPDLEQVKVEFVWNPPWDPYKMASEEAKDLLGIW